MKVALIQSSLVWENPKANRIHFEEKINGIKESVNLIVLPEMFTTGFTMAAPKLRPRRRVRRWESCRSGCGSRNHAG